jgi:hypothetical protein
MSETIIEREKGYGFTLTKLAGSNGERVYQFDVGSTYVLLTARQIVSLVFELVHHLNRGTFREEIT